MNGGDIRRTTRYDRTPASLLPTNGTGHAFATWVVRENGHR
jgi:hypothetical protein